MIKPNFHNIYIHSPQKILSWKKTLHVK